LKTRLRTGKIVLMTRTRATFAVLLTAALGALIAPSARAALPQVNNWQGGLTGLPSDVKMYIYVPTKVAANPPIVALIHYCGGTADNVFGQASGISKAADQYGFIMVMPSSGRCWDIVSAKTRTRDGGGDSHAIKQMIKYAIEQYKGNADRVYSTGDSSGAMMTELLLALYPDIFKGGSTFAGMPAGCGNTTTSPGSYDGSCAGGSVSHTAADWGDIVRKMYPGYSGHRPRIQLFHGDNDTTIRYANHTEAIKEWTNVLGLATDPTSSQTGLTLGSHQAKRQSWQNSCGYVVLDAFTSIGGDHGPSDALFVAQYVVPFLGLDNTGAVDPEVAKCGGGGTDDGGVGAGGAGGATGAGGGSTGRDGGAGRSGGLGGALGSGGRVGADGSVGAGGGAGSIGSGGSGKGGAQGGGGSQGSVGSASGGAGSGGATGGGGGVAVGGNGSGGTSGNGGTAGSSTEATSASGCNCALDRASSNANDLFGSIALGLALALLAARRRASKQP
jgi:acetylxylan esterase